jgi:hypothetical protein
MTIMITTSDGESREARAWPDGSWSCPWCGAANNPDDRYYQQRGWEWPCANPACIVGGKGNPSAVAMIRKEWARKEAGREAAERRDRFDAQVAAEREARRLARCGAAREASAAEGWCYVCWWHSTGGGVIPGPGFRRKHYKPENCPRAKGRR